MLIRRPARLTGLVIAAVMLGPVWPAAGVGVAEQFRFTDPAITESSGLVDTGGVVVTVNDSGDSGRVFAVDPATGATVGVTSWPGDPVDVEALAPAEGDQVWVADIGDNDRERSEVSVLAVPVGPGDRTAQPTAYRLRYPDGSHDAEALLAHPGTGRLFVATKGLLGGDLYAAPRRLSATATNRLSLVGPVPSVVTDGAFLPDGDAMVLRGYGRATVLRFPSMEPVGTFPLPDQEQGEGLAVAADGGLLLSSEGVEAPVLRVELPVRIRAALEQSGASEPGTESAERGSQPDPGAAPPSGEQERPGRVGALALGLAVVAAFGVAVAALVSRRRSRGT
jgi:hypothetical protein